MELTMPGIHNMNLSVFNVSLYVPPLAAAWRGDPKGHAGGNDAFFYIVEGECFLKVDNKSRVLKPGDLAYLPKELMRKYTRISENFALYEILFSAKCGDEDLFPFLNIRDAGVVRPEPDRTKMLFETSLRYEHNRSGLYDIKALSNLASIIFEYVDLYAKAKNLQKPFSDVIEYMKENVSKKITLAELSKISYMQPTYFIRKFREAYDMPPMEYYARLKVYEAMSMLSGGQEKIDSVVRALGFSDASYFSRFFKKHTGLSPVEYRAIFK